MNHIAEDVVNYYCWIWAEEQKAVVRDESFALKQGEMMTLSFTDSYTPDEQGILVETARALQVGVPETADHWDTLEALIDGRILDGSVFPNALKESPRNHFAQDMIFYFLYALILEGENYGIDPGFAKAEVQRMKHRLARTYSTEEQMEFSATAREIIAERQDSEGFRRSLPTEELALLRAITDGRFGDIPEPTHTLESWPPFVA